MFKGRNDIYKQNLMEILHMTLPNREDRNKEIREYLKENDPIKHTPLKSFNYKEHSIPKYEEIESWIETNVGDSRAIKNTFYQLCEKNKRFYNTSPLSWSINLPLEIIGDDLKIELIRIDRALEYKDTFGQITIINELFKNYSEKQIRTLFLSPFNTKDYYDALLEYSTKLEKISAFPIFTKMSQLISYMKGRESFGDYPKENFPIEGDSNLGFIEYISDYSQLSSSARYFKNCPRTHDKKCAAGIYNIYVIQSKDPIMFHVNKKGIFQEAQHKANRSVEARDIAKIKKLLKEKITMEIL